MTNGTLDRRELIGGAAALGVASLLGGRAGAQQAMPSRPVPSTGELLPVIGLGSSKVVQEIATEGAEPLERVLETLLAHGGRVVDTWPRDPSNDEAFGRIINEPQFADRLFVASKIDREGREAGIAQFRDTQRFYGRQRLDLVQIFSLTDLYTHWPTLRQWKDEGAARYIGVTVSGERFYDPLIEFLSRERPDFAQVNYSITERSAEERVLPLLRDSGVAAVINRPFMNGAYFDRLENRPLPGWAVEAGCESWAQLSLRYILANPDVTCVLTETTNPEHMAENARAAFGPPVDEPTRQRMRDLIDSV